MALALLTRRDRCSTDRLGLKPAGRAIAAVLSCLALPAGAEDIPVLGLWGGPDCLGPVEIGAGRVSEAGRTCEVAAIVALGETGAWAFRLDCDGAPADMVLMHDRTGDRLWLWQDPEATAPRLMTRCGG